MKSIKPITILLVSLIAGLTSLQALASETLDSHEHGSANLNIAIDNNLISIRFESPAVNIVGFEYQPNDEEQQARVTKAENMLSNFEATFNLKGEPNCQVLQSSANWISDHDEHSEHENDISKTDHADHSEHDNDIAKSDHDSHSEHENDTIESEHDGHSEHENNLVKAEHAEFLAKFELQCEQINNLAAIDVKILTLFPAIDEIDAQIIYPGGQLQQELTIDNTLINLSN
jgi:hypothetical protein